MIKTFSHKGLEEFFYQGSKKGIQPKHAIKIEDILDRLEGARSIHDMSYPGAGLHLLEPKHEGVWSVRVSGNWRITFKFRDGDVYDVDYLDYH